MNLLDGIKIVDFGSFLAGPYTGRILSDLGAAAIKVEPPGGEPSRPQNDFFRSQKLMLYANRGVRDIVIDLKQPEGVALAHKLIAEADVVSQNMRVGVGERLGIGPDDVRKINPEAIYLFSPGYGSVGPRIHHPSFEPLNSAFVGIHYRSGGKGNPPVQSVSLDAFCGLLGACGVMMALLERQMTGKGQYLNVSQLASAMYYTSDTYRKADGTMGPLPELNQEQAGMGPLDRLYQTQDDWICICCEKPREWAALCKAAGLDDMLQDPAFKDHAARTQNRETLEAILGGVFAGRPTKEWFALLDKAGVPCEIPEMKGEERFFSDHRHVESGLMAEYAHPLWGMVREIGLNIHLSHTPGVIRGTAPRLGQHTEEIMREAGYSAESIEELAGRGVVYIDPKSRAQGAGKPARA